MKTSLNPIVTALFLTAATTAGATEFGCPADTPAAELAQTTNTRWRDLAATGNPRALAELYAENAVLMPPSDETIVGREPIAAYLADHAVAPHLAGYTVDVVGCELSGDTLEIAGVWGVASTAEDGATATRTGNVMRVANRQQDGSFILKYEIWN